MVDNVSGIDALLADGERVHFCPGTPAAVEGRLPDLFACMQTLYAREQGEINKRFPKVARNVAGRDGLHVARVLELALGIESG